MFLRSLIAPAAFDLLVACLLPVPRDVRIENVGSEPNGCVMISAAFRGVKAAHTMQGATIERATQEEK